ncbi:MAG: hypothetical protein OEZ06_29820 [Myxococcales bacterium]|nr:hypothetical protein [Myxococcales bacterium]
MLGERIVDRAAYFTEDGDSVPGTLPGGLAVAADGRPKYSVPLQVPPGRGGIQPLLSLSYSGGDQDGYLGIGWGVSGLAAIQRCKKTFSQDGNTAVVTYTDSDSFCLDGAKLVLEQSTDTYGADGVAYRTELESFTRVISHSAGGEPSSFTAYTRDGRILTFDLRVGGGLPLGDEKIRPANTTNPLGALSRTQTWALTRVEDRLGNSMDIEYWNPSSCPDRMEVFGTSFRPACDVLGGKAREYYPKRITYTNHKDKPGDRFVEFHYRERVPLAMLESHRYGVRYEKSQLLERITAGVLSSDFDGGPDFSYELVYDEPRDFHRRYALSSFEHLHEQTLLTSIQQCARKGLRSTAGLACKPPTIFEYERVEPGFENALAQDVTAIPDYDQADLAFFGRPLVLDLDGNGQQDILYSECSVPDQEPCVDAQWSMILNGESVGDTYYLDRNRMVVSGEITQPNPSGRGSQRIELHAPASAIVVDWDLDGRDEVLEIDERFRKGLNGSGEIRVWSLDTESTLRVRDIGLFYDDENAKKLFVLDLNGDRIKDLLVCSSETTKSFRQPLPIRRNYWTARLGAPGTFGAPQEVASDGPPCDGATVADLNGDGRDELLLNSTEHVYIPGPGAFDEGGENRIQRTSDVFFPLSNRIEQDAVEARDRFRTRLVLDVSGDGLPDIVDFAAAESSSIPGALETEVWLNSGAGFVTQGPKPVMALVTTEFPSLGALSAAVPYDENHDGRLDLLVQNELEEWLLLRSNGQTFSAMPLPADLAAASPAYHLVMDVDHDGVPDLRRRASAWIKQGPLRTRLKAATDGLLARTEVYYASLTEDARDPDSGEVPPGLPSDFPVEHLPLIPYVHGVNTTEATECGYPCYPRHPAGAVVRAIGYWDKPAGSANPVRYEVHSYGRSAVDLQGRGFLGFGVRLIKDTALSDLAAAFGGNQARLMLSDNFVYDAATKQYPFVGRYNFRADLTMTGAGRWRIDERTTDYETRLTTPSSLFVYASTVTTSTREQDPPLSTPSSNYLAYVQRSFDYDDYGNQTGAIAVWNDVHDGKVVDAEIASTLYHTTTEYIDRWLISLPDSKQVGALRQRDTGSPLSAVTQVYDFKYAEELPLGAVSDELKYTGLPVEVERDPGTSHSLTTQMDYNAFGNVIEIGLNGTTIDGVLTRSQRVQYDAVEMFPRFVTDVYGNDVEYEFDQALGAALHTKQEVREGVFAVISALPDGFGRPRRTIGADDVVERVDYAGRGAEGGIQVRTARDGAPARSVAYDVLGRSVVEQREGLRRELTTLFDYHPSGFLSRRSRPHDTSSAADPNFTDFTYDALGRLLEAKPSDGRIWETCYRDNAVCSHSPRGFGKCSVFNERGEMVHGVDPGSGDVSLSCETVLGEVIEDYPSESAPVAMPRRTAVSHEHGAFGHLERIVDPVANVTAYDYDAYGRVLSVDDPNAGTWNYSRNAFGEVETALSPDMVQSNFHYDLLGRMVQREDLEGTEPPEISTYVYDGLLSTVIYQGKLVAAQSPDGSMTVFNYDDAGREVEARRSIVGAESTEILARFTDYDGFGRPSMVSYESANAVERLASRYHYHRGHVEKIGIPDKTATGNPALDDIVWDATDTDPYGQLEAISLGNGLTDEREYWPNTGQLKSMSVGLTASTALQALSYTYDDNDNLERRDDVVNNEATVYVYDEQDRLELATSTTNDSSGTRVRRFEESFTYDALGNIDSRGRSEEDFVNVVTDGFLWSYSVGTDGRRPSQVASVSDGGTEQTYEYDSAGRLKLRTGILQGDLEILYNRRGMPFLMGKDLDTSLGREEATHVAYDAFQQRVRKKMATSEVFYMDESYTREMAAGSGEFSERLVVFAGAGPVVEIERSASGSDSDATTYLHSDHLGSITAVTDKDGNLVERRSYDAFGGRRDASDPNPYGTRYGYTAHEFDEAPGLVNMKARMYDAALGRFLMPDPIVADPSSVQGVNPYSYVNNRPLRFVDPTGREPCDGGPCAGQDTGWGGDGFDDGGGPPGQCGWECTKAAIKNAARKAQEGFHDAGDFLEENVGQPFDDAVDAVADFFTGGWERGGGSEQPPRTQRAASRGTQAPVETSTSLSMNEFGEIFVDGQIDLTLTRAIQARLGWPLTQVSGDELVHNFTMAVMPMGLKVPLAPLASRAGGKLPRYHGPKPKHHVNPAHDPKSPHFNPRKTPQPADAADVYRNAVPDDPVSPRNWFGTNADGTIYRFSGSGDQRHFSGMEGVGDGIRNITDYALQRLGRK